MELPDPAKTRAGEPFPALTEIRTFWRRPWLVNLLSQHGLRHFRAGQPMQDAYHIGGNGPHSWIIIADGVGRAKHSALSSRVAVDSIGTWLARNLYERPNSQALREALSHGRDAVLKLASTLGCGRKEVATTLALAVFTGSDIAAANIGDSSILAFTETDRLTGARSLVPFCSALQPQAFFPKEPGIVDLTNPHWEDYVETTRKSAAKITALLLSTDGVSNFFMEDEETDGPLDPTLITAYQGWLDAQGPLKTGAFLADFLMNADYEPISKDDRTLVIASKIPFGQFPGLDAQAQ